MRKVVIGVQEVAVDVQRVQMVWNELHWACDEMPFSSATEEKQNINQCHQTININTRYGLIIPINAKSKIPYLMTTLTTPKYYKARQS